MFKPAPLSGVNAERYYTHLNKLDGYYTKSQEPPGRWLGSGAAALGLHERVRAKDFKDLMNGSFRGEKLHAGTQTNSKRLKAYDCPIAPPKSVSAAYAVGSPEVRSAIWRAQMRAEEAVVKRLECTVIARSGAGGKNKEPAKLIVGCFRHDNNRANEPSLHTHLVVMNLSKRADGKFCSPNFRSMLQEQKAIGAFYRATVARELEREGFAVRADAGRDENGRSYQSFELRDVPQKLTDAYSVRSTEIKAAAAEKGISRDLENRKTRAKKEPVDRDVLDARWRETARAAGIDRTDFRVGPGRDAASERAPGELRKMEISGLPKAEREAHFAKIDAEKAARAQEGGGPGGGRGAASGGGSGWELEKGGEQGAAKIPPERAAAAARGAAAIISAMRAKNSARPKQIEGLERSLERRFESDDA
jgi:conjugative relaxase-like TrwC/TraI family protein